MYYMYTYIKESSTKTYTPFQSDLIIKMDHMRISGNEHNMIRGNIHSKPSWTSSILEINKNATLVFWISFQHGLFHHFFLIRQLFFTYAIKRSFSILINCQYACLKVLVKKTSYMTACNVPHEWFLLLHHDFLANWVDYNFPTSKCWYVFSISKYSKIKS